MLRPIVVMALGPMVAVLVVDAATVMALVVHLTATRCRQMARTSPAAKSASGTHRQHVLVSLRRRICAGQCLAAGASQPILTAAV
jgi:hypothetical protein